MAGILAPLAGKQISCGSLLVGYAMVDANGNPFTRVVAPVTHFDSGWVSGYRAAKDASNYASWSLPYLTVVLANSTICTATWPLN